MRNSPAYSLTKIVERGVNAGLRICTLVSKFFLIFILAKWLDPSDLGIYGLMTVAIAYALMALGMDFYTYSIRELLVTDRFNWAALLRDQAVFYLLTYLVILPICLALFGLRLLPWSLAVWFFPLLALEHIAQEFNRLLVAISEPFWASIVLFIRSGLWAIAAVGWMWLHPDDRQLSFVFTAWLSGAAVACLLAISRLRNLDFTSLKHPIDWGWIRNGVKMALPFIVATLSLRALYTVDRYLMEALSSLEVLAAYVLFSGIANGVMSFLDAAVFSFHYPKLVSAVGRQDEDCFQKEMAQLWKYTLAATLAIGLVAVATAWPVIRWLDRPVYAQHFDLLLWAVVGTSFMAVSMVPHYGLYAKHQDRNIVVAHLTALPVFGLAVWLLGPTLSHAAVPAAVAAASLFILLIKLLMYRRIRA